MTEQEPLSDFWRTRQSNNLPEELANVLSGARGYVGFFGSDFSVNWGARSTASINSKQIELDYSPLVDKTPPFDGKDIDLVMGTSIHESGHIKWSYPESDVKDHYARKKGYYVSKGRYATSSAYLTPAEKKEVSELRTVANIIEDFYVENKISETYPTLGAYLREARKLSTGKELPHNLLYNLTTDSPSFDSVLTMWGAIALIDKTIPENASKKSKALLNKLINYTISACKGNPKKRLQISYKIWEELKALDKANKLEQERYKSILKQEQEKQKQEKQPNVDGAPSPDGEPESEEEPEPQEEDNGDEDKESKETEEKPEEKEEPDTEESETSSEEHETEEEAPEDSDKSAKSEADELEQPEQEKQEESDTTETDTETENEEPPEEAEEDEKIEEDLSEPYQSHEELRECYSFDLGNKQSMPQDLVDTVDEYLEKKPEDITQQVQQMLGGAGGKEIVMELAPSNPARANKLLMETRRTAQKVSQLFMQDKKLRTRYRRGLQEGAVDPRRLHKAGASDYKLFERKEVLSTPSLAVGVLVDASGSMGGGFGEDKIGKAIKTAMALKTALTMIDGVDLMIMAYNTDNPSYQYSYSSSNNRYTTLHRIYDRKTGEFRPDVKAAGGTPSGYAIAGMVSQIGRYLKGKDKLIIHVTDGAPNSHEEVKQAVDYCLQNNIDVMTLTLALFHDEVKESYRELCEYLDDIDKLPDAIASLLKKRLQKRMMRIK